MGNRVIKKTIAIRSSPASVWRVFTDPAVTRQMGGEYCRNGQTGVPSNGRVLTEICTPPVLFCI